MRCNGYRSFRTAVLACSLLVILSASAAAQFLPFGRNKINYEQFDWQILRTERFDIYYYPEMEELARKGGHFAEESYAELEQEFNFTITERIPLIFYSSPLHFQQTNVTPGFIPDGVGGFFEFLKGRVVIPSSGSLEQFRHVIQHELVHVFMHNKILQVLEDYGLESNRYPPLWFVEGLAEYYSTDWDTQTEMLIRDAVLNGYFAPLSNIYYISGSFLMYKEGQAFMMYLAENYGEQYIQRIIENLWKSPDFSDVLKLTIGKKFGEFDKEWIAYLKKKYYPLVEKHPFPSDEAQLIVREGFNSKPVFYRSGDSTFVLYIGNVDGYTGVYMKSLTGGPAEKIIEGEKTDEFEAFHLFQGKMALSPDGVLAFVTKSGESDVLHLYDVGRRKKLETLSFPRLVVIGSVFWSPDGTRIAFTAIDHAGQNDLYTVDWKERRLQRLTNDFYSDRDPAWSPDGRHIAFASDRTAFGESGTHNLFLYETESGAITYLTYGDYDALAPSWSPDGKLLAFTSDIPGTHNIYLIRRDEMFDSSLPPLLQRTQFATGAFDPVWTDSSDLLFTAFERFSFRIGMLPVDQSKLDSLPVIEQDVPVSALEPWGVPPIEGTVETTSLRYKKEYTLDIAQSQIATDPVFGTIGGAALSVSDLLGNENYYFLLYNTAQTSDEIFSNFNLAISKISLEQRNPYAYGVYHYSGRRYDILDEDTYYFERAFGGYFALAHPLSKFRRLEGSVSLTHSDKDVLGDITQRKALLLTNSISYVKDNALYYYTGPIDGNRFNITLAHTTDIQYSNVNYFSVMFDYRRYFRLGQLTAFATRAEILYNEGKEARRYFLGGSWDLRGFPRWSIRGTKRWLTSMELRFPLLNRVGFDFPFGAINLGLMRGALFFDAGNAWDTEYRETLGSVGLGFRLSVFGLLVLRYDIGKRIENDFTTLQSDLFHQFFFGWDF
ncbi:MAG: hypothetical protein CL946_13345 [Ectothiorhodospiraceae bacterium]|nr:hypothetical protein [Ectothiorhodospiraceae bacterium]